MGLWGLFRREPLLAAHGNAELCEQRALLRRAHGVHIHGRGRHGCSGDDRGRGRRLVVRRGSHDRGLARGARGDQEGGPRGRERGEKRGALLLAHEARPRTLLLGGRDEDGVDDRGDVDCRSERRGRSTARKRRMRRRLRTQRRRRSRNSRKHARAGPAAAAAAGVQPPIPSNWGLITRGRRRNWNRQGGRQR